MRYLLIASLALLSLASNCFASSEPSSVKLSAREKAFLEDSVCKSRYQLTARKINAYHFPATDQRPAYTSARVECEPHQTYPQGIAHYVDDCGLTGVEWSCSPPQLELQVNLNGRAVTMRPWNMPPDKAYNLMQTIGAKGYFQGVSLDKAIGSSCDIGTTKDKEIFELNCDSLITISYWCPQKKETGCPRVLFLSTAKDRKELEY